MKKFINTGLFVVIGLFMNIFSYGETLSISGKITQFTTSSLSLNDIVIDVKGTQNLRVKTSRTGTYIIAGLQKGGNYTLSISKPGYTFSPATKVFKNLEESQINQNFVASVATYSISGRVLVGGKPVRNVVIMINNRPIKYYTDQDGAYVIDNLEYNGPYEVKVISDKHQFKPFQINYLEEDVIHDFKKDITVSGRVTSLGEGVANIGININGSIYKTDADGYYKIDSLVANGDYVISVVEEKYNPSPSSIPLRKITGDKENLDFTVSGEINGKVTYNGQPFKNAIVKISDRDKEYKTNAQGVYKITNVGLNQEYTVTVSSSGYSFTPKQATVKSIIKENPPLNFKAGVMKCEVTVYVQQGENPLENVNITVNNNPAAYKTDKDGKCVISLPYNKKYTFKAAKSGNVFVETVQTINNLSQDETITFKSFLDISGKVEIDGKGLFNAVVTCNDKTVKTNKSGLYTLKNLQPNKDYVIKVSSGNYSFEPEEISVENLSVSYKDKNFVAKTDNEQNISSKTVQKEKGVDVETDIVGIPPAQDDKAKLKLEREEEAELKRLEKEEAERLAKEEKARLKEEAELKRLEKEEADRLAKEEQKRLKEEAAQKKLEEAELKRLEKEEAARLAKEEKARLKEEAELKRLEKEEASRLAKEEQKRLKEEAAQKKLEEAELKRLEKEEAARLAKEEKARLKEEAELKRLEKEEAARLAKEEQKRLKEEAAQKKLEEAERKRLEKEEADRLAKEEKARLKEEAELKKLEKEEAARLAKEEQMRLKEEAAQKKLEEAERKRLEKEEAARLAKEEKARLKIEEQERKEKLREDIRQKLENQYKRNEVNKNISPAPSEVGSGLSIKQEKEIIKEKEVSELDESDLYLEDDILSKPLTAAERKKLVKDYEKKKKEEETERLAKEEAAQKKLEEEQRKQEEAEQKRLEKEAQIQAALQAKQEAEAEKARIKAEKEEAERLAKEEQKRLKEEAAQKKLEEEQRKQEEAEQKRLEKEAQIQAALQAKQEAEAEKARIKAQKEEDERLAKEEQQRLKLEAQLKAQQEKEKLKAQKQEELFNDTEDYDVDSDDAIDEKKEKRGDLVSIEGRVLKSKYGVQGVQVRLLLSDEERIYLTDKNGYYKIPGLDKNKNYLITVLSGKETLNLSPKSRTYKNLKTNMKNQNFYVVEKVKIANEHKKDIENNRNNNLNNKNSGNWRSDYGFENRDGIIQKDIHW